MGNRVHVCLKHVQDTETDGTPSGEAYWELTVSDDEESSNTYLGKDGDPELAKVREQLVSDPLTAIAGYGAEGHYAFAKEYGAYVCDDWRTAEQLAEAEAAPDGDGDE